jgi:hypothetical protein
MPYSYPSRTCITHGCMFEKQPHVGNGDYCFKHAELVELTDSELERELSAQEYEQEFPDDEDWTSEIMGAW